jgi:formylglycine-generating enzyme required for sulfatase activity
MHASYCSGGDCPFLASVGSKPAGANWLGHRDLAGSVLEWVVDGYVGYPLNGSCSGEGDVCVGYAKAGLDYPRVIRGGAYDLLPLLLRAAFRNDDPPGDADFDVGLRCARMP